VSEIGFTQIVKFATQCIEEHALYSGRINWKEVEAHLSLQENQHRSDEDAYSYIRSLLDELGDEHSHLVTRDLAEAIYSSVSRNPRSSVIHSDLGPIGYLEVLGFIETSSLSEVECIDLIRQNIFDLKKNALIGWIVDLRKNDGGNMWPMLAGLESLLDGPCVGRVKGP